MEQYIVSARKYRPATFHTVVGQQALTTTLKNAIATDRLAHAYLFCGSRGVGKTSCARIFAKTINCIHRTADGEACNECDSCRQFNENRSLNIIELDAASHNGIDDMKGLIEQVMVPPTIGKYRVFIIDEVHMLTTAAFNAFLKTLEEPPAYVIFILATTEKHKIIPTILSRCQIYDFNRISIQDMVDHMMYVAKTEGIEAETSALNVIARKADGAMRDALSIFDQVAASSMGKITYASTIDNLNVLDHSYYSRLVDAFIDCDVPKALLIYKEIRDKGFDSQFFINGLGLYMRDLMLASDSSTISLLEASDEVRAEMALRAEQLLPSFIYRAMDLCNDADFNFRQASNKQFLIELTLIKLCQLLSPSPDKDSSDEGQLKPLSAAETTQMQAQSQPSAKAQVAAAPVVRQPSVTVEPQVTYMPRHVSIEDVASETLRLKSVVAHDQSSTAVGQNAVSDSIAVKEHRANPYTVEQLQKAWTEFIKTHPTMPLLINTMRVSKPEPVGDDLYRIRTESVIQSNIINDEAELLQTALRDMLGNDNIRIEAYESEGETSPEYWTERQVYSYILEKNSRIKDMAEKLQMRLL